MKKSVAAAALSGLLLASCASARADRDWFPYLANSVHAEMNETRFTVRPVSDWSYSSQGPVAQTYGEASYAFTELRAVWFVLEPQPGSRLAAHTFLLFEFENDRLLGLTIEARRERTENYSAVRGAFNAYELAYVWASARDLLTRRATMLAHDVYIYPINISDAREQALLRNVLERTRALQERPRFYNTLFSNCTNELAKAAGLRWNYAFVLTGASDNFLFREGLIPGESFKQAEERAHLTSFVRDLNTQPPEVFDRALLDRLRSNEG